LVSNAYCDFSNDALFGRGDFDRAVRFGKAIDFYRLAKTCGGTEHHYDKGDGGRSLTHDHGGFQSGDGRRVWQH
jgi:hypothetical protein